MPDKANMISSAAGKLCSAAIDKLASSGISRAQAERAGLYSVASAHEDLNPEFAKLPALVIPYHDQSGKPVFFDRNGERLPFVRVRYLAEPVAKGFVRKKPQRYAQLRASGTFAYFAPCVDWRSIAADTSEPVVIVEGELKALKACIEGIPTIGLGGVDNFRSQRGGGA
ncbi:DUF3854 domain-containing protein [Hyphomonas oceanitis]|uniref:DNA primase n=1 Tax=Hyphomonas oceanitis SCH89 TaxID=1280953 RepID=A0A059G329_9PROT|nr:DUF3854 domain-containing protein [Hyphomonas oceanitis]KDA00950.1 DNA primase [Hyphomonas oceanitis SCH89]